MRMRTAIMLLVLAVATPEIRHFRCERTITTLRGYAGQTCVALDAEAFAHAAPGLADLRLYRGSGDGATETAYVVRQALAPAPQPKEIAPLNLGKHQGTTTFEAEMPAGQYSDVDLDVAAKNFIATVAVTGSQTETGSEGTELGMFTVFDLTGQKLGRSTVLHLPASDFRYLYFGITGPVKPGDIQGLSVERIPAQQQFVTVADTNQVTQKDRETVATFAVPAHVPVDRVEFVPGDSGVNFSRDVTVQAAPVLTNKLPSGTDAPGGYSQGTLLRVHQTHDGTPINEEHLAVDAPDVDFGSYSSRWTVTVDNGDDAPLNLSAVRLEMAERQVCFDAASGAQYTLYYGDAALSVPQYDYATLFTPKKNAAQATLGPEQANPQYEPRPDMRPFTERYPWLLWVALILVVGLLGAVALRTAKETAPRG